MILTLENKFQTLTNGESNFVNESRAQMITDCCQTIMHTNDFPAPLEMFSIINCFLR